MDILELVRTIGKRRKDIETSPETIAKLTGIQLMNLPLGELK